MKEYEKLLFEDTKRKEFSKAVLEVKLGLFEQKEEQTFDFSNYTLMTYNKKYKGLYDLYQNNETFELVFVCPLVENNKGDEFERKDLAPYAYDVLYLEFLDAEAYSLVKKAAAHEKSKLIDIFYKISLVLYFVLLAYNIFNAIYVAIDGGYTTYMLTCSYLLGIQLILTFLMPILMIKYRKFKAE